MKAVLVFDLEGQELKGLESIKPHHLLFVSDGAPFVPPVKIDAEGKLSSVFLALIWPDIRRREEARAEEELRAQAARRHHETMQRIAEEEAKRMQEENAAEARRGPLTASTHELFVDQRLTEIEILHSLYGDLRGALQACIMSLSFSDSEQVAAAAFNGPTKPNHRGLVPFYLG